MKIGGIIIPPGLLAINPHLRGLGTPRNNGPCFCLCGLDTIARLRVRQAFAILHRAANIKTTLVKKGGE